MEEAPKLSSAVVGILGLGLMGGSLARALKGRCRSLLACDPDPAVLELARGEQIVERISPDPRQILPGTDLVILAAPVRTIIHLIQQLPDWHPGNPVVIDLGSTKVEIYKALAGLPERFDPLGGHPMCGRSEHGLANADEHLFREAPFAFTPLPRSGERCLGLAAQLAQAIGARPLWLDPETHDRWVAATSHAPYLLACALALATAGEAAPLVGPGFRSSTRLAASSLNMMEDILHTNREHVLQAIRRVTRELERLDKALAEPDYPLLRQLLQRAADAQRSLTEQRDWEGKP